MTRPEIANTTRQDRAKGTGGHIYRWRRIFSLFPPSYAFSFFGFAFGHRPPVAWSALNILAKYKIQSTLSRREKIDMESDPPLCGFLAQSSQLASPSLPLPLSPSHVGQRVLPFPPEGEIDALLFAVHRLFFRVFEGSRGRICGFGFLSRR